MDTFLAMQQAVQSDLTVGSESTLFPLSTVKLAIQRAYRKIGGLYLWPELEDAKKTSSIANQEYYDYPDNWRPDSMWKLKVDGYDYDDPLVFKDYLYEKENNVPSGATKMWSSQWRRFFIYPTPTSSGSNNICIWGVKTITDPSADSDTTIFSYSMPEVNEAIVLEAVAILRNKGGETPAVMRKYVSGSFLLSIEAKEIVLVAWNKVRENQAKYEKTQPFFQVPDFFPDKAKKTKETIGNF